jgi:hypothetical protein
MAKFIYLYTGGQMDSAPEAQEQVMQAWGKWLAGLGSSVTDMGNPFGPSASVGPRGTTGSSTLGVGGYSVITAASLEDAVAKAAGCPALQGGGTVEVYEAIPM